MGHAGCARLGGALALLAGLLALTQPAGAAGEGAPPLAGPAAANLRLRAIEVDVAPLARNGLGPEADWLAEELPARLRAVFAGRLEPGDRAAPALVVRIDLVTLGPSGGGGTQPFGGGDARDEIQGAATLVGPRGRTIASFPLFASQLDYTGGSVYERGTERRRVDQLAASFAQWLPGRMGL
jgi:hypothetical protein